MVKQQELWTNLSVSIGNLLMIAMSDLDETFRKCLPDIAFGIAITIQNITRMIHFKHKEIFYREILRTLSQFLFTQLRVTD